MMSETNLNFFSLENPRGQPISTEESHHQDQHSHFKNGQDKMEALRSTGECSELCLIDVPSQVVDDL